MSSQGVDHHSNGIHFFKVILESSLRTGELRVPASFVKRHWQGMANPVSLRLPNRTEWKVRWTKRDGDVLFCNGWKEFAEHVSLKVSQFVVFQYKGKSRFNVIVLGINALEIKYPVKATDDDEEDQEIDQSDYSLEILDDGSPFEGKRSKSASPSSQNHKKVKTNPKVHVEFDSGSKRDLKETIKAFHEKVKEKFIIVDESFTCAIHKTYTERDLLVIPNEFSKAHLHNMEGRKATLFVDQDRTWDVEFKLNHSGQLVFGNGWRKFLMDNNMKCGDVCAFVMNKCKGVSFKVVIFSFEQYLSTPLFKDQERFFHRSLRSIKPPETPKADNRLMSKDEFNISIKPSMNGVSIPISYIRNYNAQNGQSVTLRVGERSWTVTMLYYEYNSTARFSSGWPDFARGCELKVGDTCLFKMIDEENCV